jgi:hypothetical protein
VKKMPSQQKPLKSRESLGSILKTYSNKLENLEEIGKFLDKYTYQNRTKKMQMIQTDQ